MSAHRGAAQRDELGVVIHNRRILDVVEGVILSRLRDLRSASIILLLLFMGLLGVAWTYAPARGDVDSDLSYNFTLVDPAT